MTKLQEKRVAKLVDSLRSGKYKQARRVLKKGDAYCCLGVACLVAGQKFKDNICLQNDLALPQKVMLHFGFHSRLGHYFNGGSLSKANDQGKSFSEIADIIESRPKGLFV